MKARSGPSLRAIFLTALALRALAWVFLLPPWGGFDEAFHHSYVLDQREELRWPGFGSVVLRADVAREVRRWTLLDANRTLAEGQPNYETQQSPVYYWASGLVLRELPVQQPVTTLYVLRLLNASLLVLAAWMTARVAQRLFASSAWLPVAYLALMPGLGVGVCRVCNDALAAVLISIAVAATLPGSSPRLGAGGALAAGLSPWAKLYGGACVPGTLLAALRGPGRVLRWCLAVLPASALLVLSWIVHRHIFPLQENILQHRDAGLLEVPWAKDVWTLAKTHIFVSGVPSFVFPKVVYAAALLPLAFAAARTLGCWRNDGRTLLLLAIPLGTFLISLLYHAWRSYSAVGGPGGTGGWYLWAMLLPESLWMSWGLARRPLPAAWRTLGLGLFALLTILGDAVLLALPGNALLVRGHEVFGFRLLPIRASWGRFADSRPAASAALAVAFMLGSWVVILRGIVRSRRADPTLAEIG